MVVLNNLCCKKPKPNEIAVSLKVNIQDLYYCKL